MNSIEEELTKLLQAYNPTIPVFPFQIPDSVTSDAIAYVRSGNRTETKYFDKSERLEKALFYVTRVCSSYMNLTDDSGFRKYLNEYSTSPILSIQIEDYSDATFGEHKYERQYKLVLFFKNI